LVGTGVLIMEILRISAPRASLSFWQVLFASTLLWPAYQLCANADAFGLASDGVLSGMFRDGVGVSHRQTVPACAPG
jgi:hypothetical protein